MGCNVSWPVKFVWVPADNKWSVIDSRDDTQICEVYHCPRMKHDLNLVKEKIFKGFINIVLAKESTDA